jgi:hypothetical protein
VKIRIRAAFPLVLSIAVVCAGIVLAASLPAQPIPPGQAAPKLSANALQIEVMDPGDLQIPPDFRIAEYEYLMDQVVKTKRFNHVYRSGDKHAEGVADLITLRTTAQAFKQGSQKEREVTTVGGWTSIKLKLQFVDRSGKVLLEREAEGKVRFMGGNLRATYDFAKQVAAIINETTF